MRAITVCVDYWDYLAVTLPYNRHHFDEVWVVTTKDDERTATTAHENGARVFVSDAFYRNGADFNKWAALEEGLDAMGRTGWLCLMDADVMWPKSVRWDLCPLAGVVGNLFTPRRRMLDKFDGTIPPEADWAAAFSLHPNAREWAGYTQIFHASDPVLGSTPWHDVTWRHAGGADSFFQAKWPAAHKVRPPFEVLHLGPACRNWCGRASRYLDGRSAGPHAAERGRKLRGYIAARAGRLANYRHAHEKLQ